LSTLGAYIRAAGVENARIAVTVNGQDMEFAVECRHRALRHWPPPNEIPHRAGRKRRPGQPSALGELAGPQRDG
jgi:hypothetical protein